MESSLTVTLKLTLDDVNVLDLPIFDSLQAGDGDAFVLDLHELYTIEGIGFLEVVGRPIVDMNV